MKHMWRQSIWLFIMLILVFVPDSFLAQENTETPTIPPTATLELTSTATSTATLSPTETASPTAVPETVVATPTIPETPTTSPTETIVTAEVTAETTDILEVTAETSTQEAAIPTDIPIVTVEATVEAELAEETAEVTAYPEVTEPVIEVTEFATPALEATAESTQSPEMAVSDAIAPIVALDAPLAFNPPSECPIDLVIMVDQSSSVDNGEFEQQRTFVMTLLNEMAIGDLNAEAKVGVGFFSSAVFTNVDFPLTSDKTALIGNVDNYSRNFGFTQQGVAIQMAQAELQANGRSNHANVIMILTDGDPFDSVPIVNVADASENAQLDGTTLYAVGVTGEDFNPQFPVLTQSTLEDIAGDREGTNPPIPDEDLIFEITFDTMDNPAFINQIATAICDEPPPIDCSPGAQFQGEGGNGIILFNEGEEDECPNPTTEEQLNAYGIELAGNWTDTQLIEMLAGVENVGLAFQEFSTLQYNSPQNAFKSILLFEPSTQHILLVRLSDEEEYCETNPVAAVEQRARIACGGNNAFTQETMVHELGHVFLHQTANADVVDISQTPCVDASNNVGFIYCMGDPNPNDIYSASLGTRPLNNYVFGLVTDILIMGDPDDPNASSFTVQGQINRFDPDNEHMVNADNPAFQYVYCSNGNLPAENGCADDLPANYAKLSDWRRGTRGWDGVSFSPPGPCADAENSSISDFQQNPCFLIDWIINESSKPNINSGTLLVVEQEEAGADMFLNWVYRTLDLGGFINDDTTIVGDYSESQGPGDDRFYWMNENLRDFFDYYGW